jgi:hypothetical protein
MAASVGVLMVSALLAVAQAAGRSAGAQPRRDYVTFNVCQAVPGETIARAFGGKLVEARPFGDKSFSRCTYFIVLPATGQRVGYAVWMQPPEDFEELKKYIEEPRTPLTGLGDGAYMFHDKGDGRFKINVLKRGDLMFQATGETAVSARKVADAVVAHMWKTSPPPRLVESR